MTKDTFFMRQESGAKFSQLHKSAKRFFYPRPALVLNLVYKNQKSSKEILANPRYKGKVTRCLNGINHLQARKKRMIELCSQKEEYPYMTPAYKDRGALPARSNSLLCSPFSLSLPLTLFPS